MKGLDWGYGKVDPQDILTAGYEFVCRYLSLSPGKNLSQDEMKGLKDAGLKIVLVWETTADRCLSGYDAGVTDATTALQQTNDLGIKTGFLRLSNPVIYFACDDDFSGDQQPQITAYFKGVNSILGKDKTGVYGGLGTVSRCLDAGVASYAWQTSAWSNGEWDDRANLRQVAYNRYVSEVQCDVNTAMASDFGQF